MYNYNYDYNYKYSLEVVNSSRSPGTQASSLCTHGVYMLKVLE